MTAIRKLLNSPPTTFVATATFLGLLVDLVTGWKYLSSFVDSFFPLVADETPYLLFIATVAGIGVLRSTYLVVRWLVDKLSGGPKQRQFSAMQRRIRGCKSLLHANQSPSTSLMSPPERTEQRTNTLFELSRLQSDLNAIGIGTPPIEIDDWRAIDQWILYLVQLDGYVRYKDLQGARTEFRHVRE